MVKQLIVELDDALARELERVAPARTRRRSSFVRAAVRRALDDLAEARMKRGYAAKPDVEPAYFDPRVWEAEERQKASRRKRR
jgi:predicted transcriptional regulator